MTPPHLAGDEDSSSAIAGQPLSRRLQAARRAPLTYPEVGATTGRLPAGYRHVNRTQDLGVGTERFRSAAGRLLTWQLHRRAGLTVQATEPRAAAGTVVLLGLGVRRLRLLVPCRVVLVLDEPRRQGFSYGTLPGHPETGEELFVVTIDQNDQVRLQITAFSRPASWWAHLAGPAGGRVQDHITDRYLAALTDPGPEVTTATW